MKYCPQCAKSLSTKEIDGKQRFVCANKNCGYINWNNPIPVVCVIVETERGIVLAHDVNTPAGNYSVISGFVEAHEQPEATALRETKEELNLTATEVNYIGTLTFEMANQLIITYHVLASGDIKLNEELDDYKIVSRDELNGYKESGKFEIEKWLKELKVTA